MADLVKLEHDAKNDERVLKSAIAAYQKMGELVETLDLRAGTSWDTWQHARYKMLVAKDRAKQAWKKAKKEKVI